MPEYFIGTAGWSYKDWVPVFYPKTQSGNFDWLRFYATFFDFVEVNSTYYTYVSPHITRGWVQKTDHNDDFLFSVKLHQDFTHKRRYDLPKIKAVRNALDILTRAGRLGGLLLQFPYSFSFDDGAVEHIRKLDYLFREYPRFLEIRHNSWNRPETVEFCNELGISLCTIDQPQIGSAVPFAPVVTAKRAYIRLHGRNEEAWKQSISSYGQEQTYEQQNERYKYLYTPAEVTDLAQSIKEATESAAKEIYVIANNHPTGYAAANAFELLHLLKEQAGKVRMPETIVNTFERLRPKAEVVRVIPEKRQKQTVDERQGSLFG